MVNTDSKGLEEWRRANHTFPNIPPVIQGLVRNALAVPEKLVDTILPDRRLSVLDFVEARLPMSDPVQSYPNADSFDFFSTDAVTSNIDISSIPIPPRPTLAFLKEQSTQRFLDGAESICLPTCPNLRLPIWVVSLWTEALLVLAPLQKKWIDGLAFAHGSSLLPFPDKVKELFNLLKSLSWHGNISVGNFGHSNVSKSILPTFLSRDWLTDEHIDQSIALLKQSLRNKAQHPFLIDTVQARFILRAYGDNQYDPGADSYLPKLGRQLTLESVVGGIFHVHGNHWVSIVLLPREGRVLYGDPAGLSPDIPTIRALVWFLKSHLPSLHSVDQFIANISPLPTPHQNLETDSWNCGVFSYNALHHYFDPTIPLLSHTENPSFGDASRVQFLIDLLCEYNDKDGNATTALPLRRSDLDKYLHPTKDSHTQPAPKASKSSKHPQAKAIAATMEKVAAQLFDKPNKKPRTNKVKREEPRQSVIAPVFQIPPRPAPNPSKRKHTSIGSSSSDDDTDSDTSADTDVKISASCKTKPLGGRPTLDVLDLLTVECKREIGKPRKYKCAGSGCTTTWCPRSAQRVLAHARNCLLLSSGQRKLASTQSAAAAPGALVAKDTAQTATATTSSAATTTTTSVASTTSTASSNAHPSDFWGPRGRKETHRALDHAITKLFCVAALPPHLADYLEWKDVFKITCHSYAPASRTKLMESHIFSEQAFVIEKQLEILRKEERISISFDGGSIRSGESLYTVHATTEGRRVMFVEGRECTDVSHTGEWLADLVLDVIDKFGRGRVAAFSSDNTGNTRVARRILQEKVPQALNLQDPEHHLNNTWKEIASLEYFDEVIKVLRATIKFFRHSNVARSKLKALRKEMKLGAGLESIGKTQFATVVWSALSLQRCLPAIRQLVSEMQINLLDFDEYFQRNTPKTLQFEIHLTQLIAVGDPFARSIACLEATAANPGDVYLYWVALCARLKEALHSCHLPSNVCAQVRRIVMDRWKEFFIDGPTNAHLSALYLNPEWTHSDFFRRPNALSFHISLAGQAPASAPPGIRNPKTFLEVGRYLHHRLVIEVTHGIDPYLTSWKDKPAAVVKAFQAQFTAFARGDYPFKTSMLASSLGQSKSPYEYWKEHEGTADGGVLAGVALKLFSAVPHSMADERTMSYITILNTAQRNRQTVDTVVSMSQVRGYYRAERIEKSKKTPHRTTVRFYNIKRIGRSIDDDEREPSAGEDDDESDDDDATSSAASTQTRSSPPSGSEILPIDELDGDFNVEDAAIRELLADGPILRESGVRGPGGLKQVVDEAESGGTFDLGDWE